MKARDRKGFERAKERYLKKAESEALRYIWEESTKIRDSARKELLAQAKTCRIVVTESVNYQYAMPKDVYINRRNREIAQELAECLVKEGLVMIEEEYDPITNRVVTRASVKLFYDPKQKTLGEYKPMFY